MEQQTFSQIEATILPCLSKEDDPEFWAATLEFFIGDVESFLSPHFRSHEIFLQIGACSHWLRPHQSRWTAAGGFAIPQGYLGGAYFWGGLPEFDWSVRLFLNPDNRDWSLVEKFFGKRKLVFRVALPTRTRRHNQAAIHTIWSPGTPDNPDEKLIRFFGFRKVNGEWKCVAHREK